VSNSRDCARKDCFVKRLPLVFEGGKVDRFYVLEVV